MPGSEEFSQAAGRMQAALQFSEQCCADSERVLGSDYPATLACMTNLAHLYNEPGRIGDAQALLRRIAAYCEGAFPHGHPLTQAVCQSLANIGKG